MRWLIWNWNRSSYIRFFVCVILLFCRTLSHFVYQFISNCWRFFNDTISVCRFYAICVLVLRFPLWAEFEANNSGSGNNNNPDWYIITTINHNITSKRYMHAIQLYSTHSSCVLIYLMELSSTAIVVCYWCAPRMQPNQTKPVQEENNLDKISTTFLLSSSLNTNFDINLNRQIVKMGFQYFAIDSILCSEKLCAFTLNTHNKRYNTPM